MERGLRQMSGHVDRQNDGSTVTRAENREAQKGMKECCWEQRESKRGKDTELGEREKKNTWEQTERTVVASCPFIQSTFLAQVVGLAIDDVSLC